MKRLKLLGLLVSFAVLIGCANFASANLIVNGNFDTNTYGWGTGEGVWAWYNAADRQSPDGPAALYVFGLSPAWLYQDVATPAFVEGQVYEFSFLATAPILKDHTTMPVDITVGSGTHTTQIAADGSWKEYTIEYTATAADVGQPMRVGFFASPGDLIGIDTVVFEAVPEPATMCLLGAGSACVLLRRKRK